ncbi:hypothetical protein NY2A_B122L [Paramecium bursaria Chlorella virus NY2A]|uniref:Uncharacterized protein B122L n=1 Tax=Paramecium bursaria Chlorella virus NY2A TaxID=46021 RepID=A7IVZ7_PBCVN|nr:hypothetical protein NY2A_B122L [Paramecium bursaria Chlorella virus NY2A]ABT14521.1 hypothetical protein NY2A_B122L [Paramecium bursaria Chlorella virus NY2A]
MEQLDNLNKINSRLEKLKHTLKGIDKKNVDTTGIRFDKDRKILTKEEFYSDDFLRGYVRCDHVDDIEVGDFVRYKQKRDGVIRYLWGGLVTYKTPEYLRLKNVYNGATWSVQLAHPDIRNIFYVKQKMSVEDIDAYTVLSDESRRLIDLNTATSMGLIKEIIHRGDGDLILEAAGVIAENNDKTIIFKNTRD